MQRLLRSTLGVLALAPVLLCAQTGQSRKPGAIFKDEIDQLIGAIRSTAREDRAGVLGDSVLSTAKILVAMSYSHRRYHISDGPVVRPSIDYLIRHRAADGGFGDATTSRWVADALRRMDAEAFQSEVAAVDAWFLRQQEPVADFDQRLAQVLDEVRADVFPQHLAGKAPETARTICQTPATLDRALAAETLVQLVACQVANRRLDQGQDPAGRAVFSPAQAKAHAWLMAQQSDGVFAVSMPTKNDKGETVMRSFPDVGLTGLGLLALQTKPKAQRTAAEQAAVDKGLAWLVEKQNADGTFGERLPNYTTCVVVGALTHSPDARWKPLLDKAQRAILAFQNIESTGYQRADRDYGSIGYGNSQRGDLSNLHFSVEALRATGLPENHEALQKALVFLQRTQNLKSVNDFKGKVPDPDREGVILDATSGDDGGASYYPGNSNAGYLVQPDGKSIPRSYGSMTYALLKAYILAGLKGDDPRVVAAVKWIQQNWTLAVNPGADPALGEKVQYQGLFYYYMVLAQALDLAGIKTVEVASTDDKGAKTTKAIDWRQALRQQLEGMQQADGTWINGKNSRWMEDMPLLCTCYAMTALERCR